MTWLDGIIKSMDMNLRKLQEIVRDREAWHAVVHGVTKSDTTKQINNNCAPSGPSTKVGLGRQVLPAEIAKLNCRISH